MNKTAATRSDRSCKRMQKRGTSWQQRRKHVAQTARTLAKPLAQTASPQFLSIWSQKSSEKSSEPSEHSSRVDCFELCLWQRPDGPNFSRQTLHSGCSFSSVQHLLVHVHGFFGIRYSGCQWLRHQHILTDDGSI